MTEEQLIKELEWLRRRYEELFKCLSEVREKVYELEPELKKRGLWLENDFGDLSYNVELDEECAYITKMLIGDIAREAKRHVKGGEEKQ